VFCTKVTILLYKRECKESGVPMARSVSPSRGSLLRNELRLASPFPARQIGRLAPRSAPGIVTDMSGCLGLAHAGSVSV
jgi:hypothetical protein